jgi:hypothetical protein
VIDREDAMFQEDWELGLEHEILWNGAFVSVGRLRMVASFEFPFEGI